MYNKQHLVVNEEKHLTEIQEMHMRHNEQHYIAKHDKDRTCIDKRRTEKRQNQKVYNKAP